ncbi:hypothetical protein GBA52_011025 [Prunus armeniaca]|nr:hypothetical protein GBA52_011025 [Prunus armeniaca]
MMVIRDIEIIGWTCFNQGKHPTHNSNTRQHSSPSRSHHPLTWLLQEQSSGAQLLLGSLQEVEELT